MELTLTPGQSALRDLWRHRHRKRFNEYGIAAKDDSMFFDNRCNHILQKAPVVIPGSCPGTIRKSNRLRATASAMTASINAN